MRTGEIILSGRISVAPYKNQFLAQKNTTYIVEKFLENCAWYFGLLPNYDDWTEPLENIAKGNGRTDLTETIYHISLM